MNRLQWIFGVLMLGAWLLGGSARAELTIQITKGQQGAQPIAIVPFGSGVPLPVDIAAVVSADLARSGRFEPLAPNEYVDRPTSFDAMNMASWRALRVNNVAVGQVTPAAGGYTVQFELADVYRNDRMLGYSFTVGAGELRKVAHAIADLIYERLTGEKGAFDTRIAYVTASGRGEATRYSLIVADADGYNPQLVLGSAQPIMSPVWSPDGRRLAYVSFEGRRSQVVVHDIHSGAREVVSASPGINGAPAWSPDGRRLALSLSRDGDPEIYVLDLGSRALQRLTHSAGIDTEPEWTPDGGSILFTSDRGGAPQIYRISASGGRPDRVSFEGAYNSRPRISADGRYITMVRRERGRFHIAVQDNQTRQTRLLTEGGLDESPSFAPNGGMILYATARQGRGVLAVVSVDGRALETLQSQGVDVRDPAWSPYGR